jgi:gliding motility-associated-like protein
MKQSLIVLLLLTISFITKAQPIAQQEVELCPGSRTNFTYSSTANTTTGSWIWTLNSTPISTTNNATINWTDTGYFTIKVQYTDSCGTDIKSYIVYVLNCRPAVIYFPNAFTPNRDGINDGWRPIGVNIVSIKYNIWNRWGEKVFEGHSMNDKWNGIYKGMPQDIATFVVQAFWKDITGKEGYYKGFIILIR